MSSENVAKEIAAAIGERPVMVPMPCRNNSKDNSDETHVLKVYDLFFNLIGDGPHFPGARSWNYMRMTKRIHPVTFFFHLLTLMTDTGSEGSVRALADRNEQPDAYAKCVALAAKISIDKAAPQDKTAFKTMTIADHLVDHRFLHDVENAKRKIRHDKINGKQKNNDGGGNKNKRKRKAIKFPNTNWAAEVFLDSSANGAPILRGLTNFYKTIAKLSPSEVDPDGEEEDEGQEAAPAPGGVPKNGGGGGESGFVPDDFPEDHPVLTPKVTMTVSPIPREGGDHNVHEDIVGLYVRFLVRDPHLNPGVFFGRILNNLATRNMPRAGPHTAPDLFANYATLFYSDHPAGNKTSKQTYFNCATEFAPELRKDGNKTQTEIYNAMNVVDTKDRFHLANILTTKRAVTAMIDAGAAYKFTRNDIEHFYWDPVAQVARFPQECSTYKYNSISVFWTHPKNVGLVEQYFPHIDMDADFLSILKAGGSLKNYFSDEDRADGAVQRIIDSVRKSLLEEEWVIERKILLEDKQLNYQTNNEMVHRAVEASLMNKKIAQLYPAHYRDTMREIKGLSDNGGWRDCLDDNEDLRVRVGECEFYNKVIEKAQQSCLKGFCGLWQLEGNVDDLPISGPLKLMLKWYRDNQATRLPNLTREYTLWDPTLGMFANSMLKHTAIFAGPARILQPLLCLLTEGLFSTYHWAPKKLCFNLLAHGKYGVGKTFPLITIPIDFACIPGTIIQYCTSTAAADTTQKHSYDEIIASDEVPEWKVNKKEALKNPERVNKEKIKMTERQVGHKVFVNEKTPLGENIRWARTITTDHYVALIEVTNAIVESKEALSSRYHRVTVPQPPVPSRELEGPEGPSIKQASMLYLNINQFLSACGYKAAMCGAMLPEPEMQLFNDISNRVIAYLIHKKSIDKEVGERGLEIMKPYVRQLVYHMAIHYTFDMPSSPHYMKKFDVSMIRDMQPYLYVTTEQIWWTWTALACGWIEENNSNVLNAAMKVAGVNWDPAESAYQHYEGDVNNKIPFRECKIHDELGIDLQYITLVGTFDQICSKIAIQTCPKLSQTDVAGILKNLSQHMVKLTRGGYKHQPAKMAAEWHKFTNFETKTKNTGSSMPDVYCERNPIKTIARTQADWPFISADAAMPAVDLADAYNGKKVYIMPGIAHLFQTKTIVEALVHATVCKTFRPGKMLLGLPEESDARMLKVFSCPPQWVDRVVSSLDEKDGWIRSPNQRGLVWKGDPNVPEEERPVSRRLGIQFNRRGGLSETESVFFNSVSTAPIKEGDTEWKAQCERDLKAMGEVRDIAEDLDYESAERRHMKCGRPLDEPVRSQQWIRQQYEEACNKAGKPIHQDMDYPFDNYADMLRNNAIWNANSVTDDSAKATAELTNLGFGDFSMARKEKTRHLLEKKRPRVENEVESPPQQQHRVSSATAAENRPASYDKTITNTAGSAKQRAQRII